jgi:hypothetical protein
MVVKYKKRGSSCGETDLLAISPVYLGFESLPRRHSILVKPEINSKEIKRISIS